MRSWVLCSLSILCLWLLTIFMAFSCFPLVLVVLSGISCASTFLLVFHTFYV